MAVSHRHFINFGLETPFIPFETLSSAPVVISKIASSATCTIIGWVLLIYFLKIICCPAPEPSDTNPSQRSSRSSSRSSVSLRWDDTREFLQNVTTITTIVCVVAHSLWPFFLLIQTSGLVSTPWACRIFVACEMEIIGLARTSFYCILALRTRVSFFSTSYELNGRKLIGITICIFLFIQAQVAWSYIVGPEKLLRVSSLNMNVCLITWDLLNVIVYGITDVSITFWLMYGFGKRLAATLESSGSTTGSMDIRMLGVLRKWLLLGWWSIIGTWVLQVFGLFISMMEISGSLDSLMNIVCVVAVYAEAAWIYDGLCGRVEAGCLHCCECCFHTNSPLLAMSSKSNIQPQRATRVSDASRSSALELRKSSFDQKENVV